MYSGNYKVMARVRFNQQSFVLIRKQKGKPGPTFAQESNPQIVEKVASHLQTETNPVNKATNAGMDIHTCSSYSSRPQHKARSTSTGGGLIYKG